MIYFFLLLVALGLCGRTQVFSSCREQGLLFPVASHCRGFSSGSTGLGRVGSGGRAWRGLGHGLSSCGMQVQSLHGMWDLPRPGVGPVSLHCLSIHRATQEVL